MPDFGSAIECERVFFVAADGGPNESISGEIGRGQIGTMMCVPMSKDFKWFWDPISMIDPKLLELIKCILASCGCLSIIFFLIWFAATDEDMDDELLPSEKRSTDDVVIDAIADVIAQGGAGVAVSMRSNQKELKRKRDELSPSDRRREMRSRFVRESSSDEDETSDPVLKMFTKKTNIPTNVRLGPSQKWRYS